MTRRRNNMIKLLAGTALALALLGLAVPPLFKKYVTTALADLRFYDASLADVNFSLLDGSYCIDTLIIKPNGAGLKEPLLVIPKIEISLQWKPLLHGRVVTSVRFTSPRVYFEASEGTRPQREDWVAVMKKLTIFPVNRVTVKNGVVNYRDDAASTPVSVFLRNVEVESNNLANVTERHSVWPSTLFAQAHSAGDGALSVVMKLNVFRRQPDFDMDLKFEGIEMPAIKNFLYAYTNVDVLKGRLNLYSEVTVLDGRISGYVTPRLENVTLNGTTPLRVLMGRFYPDGKQSDQLVTRVELNEPVATQPGHFWPSVWSAFCRASREGFEQNTREASTVAAADM